MKTQRMSAADLRAAQLHDENHAWLPHVVKLIADHGGRAFHINPVTITRGGRKVTITATSIPGVPDLFCWFPEAGWGGLHPVELKADSGYVKPHQRELFASMEAAGAPVPIWKPRNESKLVLPTLEDWSTPR
jgi:hypothetical protein